MSIKFPTIPPKRLAQSIITSSTTFKLTDILGWDGEDLTSVAFGDQAWAIFRNESGSVLEIFEFDPTTIADAAITIVARGLDFGGASTSDSARKLNWPSFETIVQIGTDAPQVFQYLKDYIDGIAIAGSPDASTSAKGLVESAIASEIDSGATQGGTGADLSVRPDQLALSIYGTRLPSANEKAGLAGLTAPTASNLVLTESDLTGVIIPYAGRSAPTGWLLCDGTAVSRTTYARLKTIICPAQTATITIASPGVVTATAHGLVAGEKIHFTTTGALPTGISTNTDYYVLATSLATDTFKFALSPGGVAVVTSGSQSGVQSIHKSAFGRGDGSTTFNVPDLRARTPVGLAATAPTTTLSWEPSARSSNDITIPTGVFPAQGQKVQVSSTGTLPTGLSAVTDYWIIRNSTTSIAFATTQANANAGTKVSLSGDGTGVITMTFTNSTHTILGRNGGEETHGLSKSELAAHTHTTALDGNNVTDNGDHIQPNPAAGSASGSATTSSTGSDGVHNVMQPYSVVNYIIKT